MPNLEKQKKIECYQAECRYFNRCEVFYGNECKELYGKKIPVMRNSNGMKPVFVAPTFKPFYMTPVADMEDST